MLKPDEKQLLIMALAHLSVERPGWGMMLGDFADTFDPGGLMFEHFVAFRQAAISQSDQQGDMILQLRQAVEKANPMLWAMVAEIAWPGGR